MADTDSVKLIDNINERLADDLKKTLTAGSKVAVAAASFSLYAYEALKEELGKIAGLRFIFTSPTFIKNPPKKEKREFYIPRLNRERNLYGSEFEIRLRNKLSQKAIARECADWIRQKARFKTNTSDRDMPGFIYAGGDAPCLYSPIKEFTTTELGLESGNDLITMIQRSPAPMAQSYLKAFDQQWNDGNTFKDVTDTVLDYVETVYQDNAPETVYFLTLYNIFHEFLDDISEDNWPNEATGFKSSVIWNKLYNFQRDATTAIINKLETYNGCILADSVGLGKTFTALAVIKYYENRNKSVMVLCPKRLNDNWTTYTSNYVNNPLVNDRLRYDVFFHTDMGRQGGTTNGKQLDKINWGNYDLIVIDESHNFRNGGKIRTGDEEDDPKENRYLWLLSHVIQQGVKTKVLMLSATPVNNGFKDLKNQIALAYEGDSHNIDSLLDTSNGIDTIFRQAQAAYNSWVKQPEYKRTTADLISKLSYDFFKVLDSVTIARSRKHIQRYYDTSDIGSFPERRKPISRRPHLTDIEGAVNYKEIYAMLNKLTLAVYTPSLYLLESRKDKYEIKYDGSPGISLVGRDRGVRQFMNTALMKRLESSVESFRLTIRRISDYISEMIERIDDFTNNGNGGSIKAPKDLGDIDDEDFDDTLLTNVNSIGDIDLDDMDYVTWREKLSEDLDILKSLAAQMETITPEHDSKLKQLKDDIADKINHPFNEGNKKILIFTAFSDTAAYIYDNVANWIKDSFGVDTAMITGANRDKCTNLSVKRDFNELLVQFSPVSKERGDNTPHHDIDVLIATDCISEGQNLQDCDYLINYDIHWNPVRIIQRFGRIDRIGSRNKSIQLVNYWPDMELDEYIRLKRRVEARMKVTVLTATGDDNPLTDEEKGDLEYRKKQLLRLQEEVTDLEDMDAGVNIMDLGFNEFRLDLVDYMKNNPDITHMPYGLNAVVGANDMAQPGVIYVLRNRNQQVNINHQNMLHPFYMVYIDFAGNVVCDHLSPKHILDIIRALCRGKDKPDKTLCQMFNKETRQGWKMDRYSALLQATVESIIGANEEKDLDSFFEGKEGDLFTDDIKGLDDFELISFFVIKG